jgi:hypothetical protein
MFNNFFPADGAVYDIKWKNMVEPNSPKTAIWHIRFGCWISKVTDKHSEYETLIVFHSKNSYANAPQCYVYTYIPPLILNLVGMPRTPGSLQRTVPKHRIILKGYSGLM